MALDRAELAEVKGAIQEFASPHREVLGLVFGSGLSLPEVADVHHHHQPQAAPPLPQKPH